MEDGKQWRQEQDALLGADGLKEYSAPASWCIPYYKPGHVSRVHREGGDPFDQLGACMRDLVALLGRKSGASRYAPGVERTLLKQDEHQSYWDHTQRVFLDPRVADLIDAIDGLIKTCITITAEAGIQQGSNALFQLAAGKITLEQLNEETLRKKE